MPLPQPDAFVVAKLGEATLPSPLRQRGERFVDDGHRVLACANMAELQPFWDAGQAPPTFEPAGPRSQIFFDPPSLSCGIVTCGGLCPGLNNVIRSIVLTLTYAYGVTRMVGFRYGYAGLASSSGFDPILLTPEVVENIHEHGGSLLGSSRGPQELGDMVDTLVKWNVGVLFAIGGDGTLRGASALCQEIARRNLSISVIGVPKTIDNDLEWIDRSFGFATAVEAADNALVAAHAEARGAWNGVGLVKLMGRDSGFIAAHTSLANSDVNFCLVPEVAFQLEGESGFLHALEERLDRKHHAVVVVAEGAGQDILRAPLHLAHDASGNVRYQDIGVFLRDQIARHFANRGKEVTIKYIDPSYIIRGIPANSVDSEYCVLLGQHAVHAGMAGRTNMVVGYWNQHFTHIPIGIAVARRKQLDPEGDVWPRVLEATGQPVSMADLPAF
jgi:6-phosphofructokinase 1